MGSSFEWDTTSLYEFHVASYYLDPFYTLTHKLYSPVVIEPPGGRRIACSATFL